MANLTKTLLAGTLMQMLQTRPLDKITVQDITDKCGLNRNTFYYHFENTYILLEWVFSNAADEVIDRCMETGDLEQALIDSHDLLHDNRDKIYNIMSSIERKTIEDFIYEYLDTRLTELIRRIAGESKPSEQTIREVAVLCKYSVAGSILKWIDDGLKPIPEPNLRKLAGIFRRFIDRMI